MSRRTGIWGLVLLALAGCLSPQARLQMADDAEARKDLSIKTVGDIAIIRAAAPVQVSGLGIVTGLDGTGGTPQGPYRQALEQLLRKQKIEHVKELIDSPNNAMVMVTGFIPPGARVGEKIDVEAWLPPGSKASSLAGGYLQMTALRIHASTKTVVPEYDGPDRALAGQVMARAHGLVMVGTGEGVAASELKRGRVWRGGTGLIAVPYQLILRNDDTSTRVTNAVAERINTLFQDDAGRLQRLNQQARQLYQPVDAVAQQINRKFDMGAEAGRVARAKSKELVELRLPFNYRLNPDRYLYIAHLVPLAEEAEQQTRYRRRLQKLLMDPAETVMAARRLEAVGRESIPALRQGLTHAHPLVRFASAEALAYLGDTGGVDDLGKLALEHPLLAGGCITALASLDEPACRLRLSAILTEGQAELRSAAFTALRQLAEHDLPEPGLKTAWGDPFCECLHKQLGGELLGGSFWLHRVAPGSPRLISIAPDTRAEVVLFGDNIVLTSPVRTLVGQEFALTFEPGGDRCTVSRFSPRFGKRQKLCPPALDEVIRTLAELGADYPDVTDLIRKLDEKDCLNAKVRLNTPLPEVTPQMLAEWGRDHRTPQDGLDAAERKLLETLPTSIAPATH